MTDTDLRTVDPNHHHVRHGVTEYRPVFAERWVRCESAGSRGPHPENEILAHTHRLGLATENRNAVLLPLLRPEAGGQK